MNRLHSGDRWIVTCAGLLAMAGLAAAFVGPVLAVPVLAVLAVVLVVRRRTVGEALVRQASTDTVPTAWGRLVQAWWTPIAAVTAAIEVVLGITIALTGDNWSGRLVGGLGVMVGCGLLTLYGLRIRPERRYHGNVLVLVGTLPWFTVFWMVLPPLMALLVWLGMFRDGFGSPRARRPLAAGGI